MEVAQTVLETESGLASRVLEGRILRGSSVALAGSVVSVLLGYAGTIAIVRLVPVETYGRYQLALSALAMIEQFVILGLPYAIIRYVAHYEARRDAPGLSATISSGLRLTLRAALVAVLLCQVALAVVPSRFFPFDPRTLVAVRVACLLLILLPLKEIAVAALRGFQRIDLKVLVDDVAIPVVRLMLILLVLTHFPTMMALVGLHLAGVGVGLVLALYLLLSRRLWVPLNSRGVSRRFPRQLLRFSVPLLGSNLATVFLFQAPRLLVGAMAGAYAAGLFSAALKISAIILFPYAALSLIFEPLIAHLYAERESKQLAQTFKTVTAWSLAATLPIGMLLVVLGRDILAFLGPAYVGSYRALVFLVMAQLVQTGFGHVGQFLVMTGRVRLNLHFMLATAAVSLPLTIAGIRLRGFPGAAAAAALTFLFANALAVALIWRSHRVHPFKAQWVKTLIAGLAAFLPALALHRLVPGPFVLVGPLVILGYGIAYGLLLWSFRPDPTDLALLRQAWQWARTHLSPGARSSDSGVGG